MQRGFFCQLGSMIRAPLWWTRRNADGFWYSEQVGLLGLFIWSTLSHIASLKTLRNGRPFRLKTWRMHGPGWGCVWRTAVRRCCTLAAMSILCATNGSMKDVRRLTVQQDAIMWCGHLECHYIGTCEIQARAKGIGTISIVATRMCATESVAVCGTTKIHVKGGIARGCSSADHLKVDGIKMLWGE